MRKPRSTLRSRCANAKRGLDVQEDLPVGVRRLDLEDVDPSRSRRRSGETAERRGCPHRRQSR